VLLYRVTDNFRRGTEFLCTKVSMSDLVPG